jgi:hypothetical protein
MSLQSRSTGDGDRRFAVDRTVGRSVLQEEGDMANQTTTRPATGDDDAGQRDLAATTRDVASGVAERASTVAARLPEAAATTRGAVEEAARRMEAGSDEMLAVGASLSLGIALGLLLGGANRILVALALIPATAMGVTLLDRFGGGRTSPSAASARRGA